MERIASFTVDHNVLTPGLYLSRRDGNTVTFDLRFKKPNTGDLLTNAELHSVEHIIATLLRNSEQKDAVIYFGPMGCQTGFYFLFDGAQLTNGEAIRLLQQVFRRRSLRGRDAGMQRGGVRQLPESGCSDGAGLLPVLCGGHRGLGCGETHLSHGKIKKFLQKQRVFLLTNRISAVILDKPL